MLLPHWRTRFPMRSRAVVWPGLVAAAVASSMLAVSAEAKCCGPKSSEMAQAYLSACLEAGDVDETCCDAGAKVLCRSCEGGDGPPSPLPACLDTCTAWYSSCANLWVDTSSQVRDVGVVPCRPSSLLCASLNDTLDAAPAAARDGAAMCALAGVPAATDPGQRCSAGATRARWSKAGRRRRGARYSHDGDDDWTAWG